MQDDEWHSIPASVPLPDDDRLDEESDIVDANSGTGGLPPFQLPSQPLPAERWLNNARRTWADNEPESDVPFVGAPVVAPDLVGAMVAPGLVGAGVGGGVEARRGQKRRRRWASGWSTLCIAALILILTGYITTLYLRSNVQQPGSGQAEGVEIHPTPVTPLAQLQTPQPTPTPKPQPTSTTPTGSGQKKPDPQATPTQGTHNAAPTRTPSGTKGVPQSTPTPVIVPTIIPTAGPTPVATQVATATTVALPTATLVPPTPTSIPPTPTPIPEASAGSLNFTDQSQEISSPADLTGCPSGCSFGTQPVSGSVNESTSRVTTGRTAQTQLSGTLLVIYWCTILNPPNECADDPAYYVTTVSGGGWTCTVNKFLVIYQSANVGCTFYVSSPTYLAPNTISGQDYGIGGPNTVLEWDSTAFNGNGGQPYVTQSDCTNALSYVENEGWSWVANTWNNAANGNIVARGYSDSENGWSCYPGVGAGASSFTASVNVYINNGLVYSPSGPTNAALAWVKGEQPGGWNWIYTSPACYPSTVSVSGNSVTAACQDSVLLTYAWTASDMAGLAQAVAGQSLSAAQATCNAYVHVAGNCVASSNANNTMPPPSDWQSITISPQNPPNPFGSADTGTPSLSLGTAFSDLLPLLSMALLFAGCTGVFQRRQRRRNRKAV